MKHLFISLLLLNAVSLSAQVRITYTGNMGVLLQSEQCAVLVDGLHEFYKPGYQHPSQEMVKDLLTEGGRYPTLDISLVTHYHGDHYSASLHAQLSTTLVIGSAQITEPLKNHGYINFEKVPYSGHLKKEFEHRNILVQAFRMDHTNQNRHRQVQNIGYLITLQNTKILHVGDTDWFPEMLRSLDLARENIDVAILPVWLLMNDNSKALLEQYIKAKQLIATHIDPRTPQKEIESLKGRFPQAIFLRTLGEEYQF